MFSGPHRYNLDNSYPRRSRQSSAKYDTEASWSEAEKTRRRKLMWVKNAMKIFVQLEICLNIRLDLVLKWAKIELNSMLIHNSTEKLKHSRVFRNFSVFFSSLRSLDYWLTLAVCGCEPPSEQRHRRAQLCQQFCTFFTVHHPARHVDGLRQMSL